MRSSPGSSVRSYRDLLVWQKAIELSASLYRLTETFPAREIYGLTSQIRRSAISVPSNIAEGQGRLTTGEFRHFLGIARGSNFEIQTQLEIARVMGIGDEKMLAESETLSQAVGRLIFFLLKSLTK